MKTSPTLRLLQKSRRALVEKGAQRTDCIVLACTHYPLLLKQFERLASWPVAWIDPAEAIARRLDHVLQEKLGVAAPDTENWPQNAAMFTSGAVPSPALAKALHERGIGGILEKPDPDGDSLGISRENFSRLGLVATHLRNESFDRVEFQLIAQKMDEGDLRASYRRDRPKNRKHKLRARMRHCRTSDGCRNSRRRRTRCHRCAHRTA